MNEGWIKVELGAICKFIGGGTPSKKEPTYWNGDIPWASIKDIKGKYLNSTKDSITNIGLKNSASNTANVNELILATRINPGRPIIARIKSAINQDLKIVIPIIDIDLAFLYYTFLTLEKEVLKESSGTTVLGISLNKLKQIDFPLAPLPEQRAIVAKIEELTSELDNGINNLSVARKKLDIYRQAVLQKAFEGELTRAWREEQTELPTAQELLVQIKEERKKHHQKQLEAWQEEVKAWEEGGRAEKKPSKPKKVKEVSALTEVMTCKLGSLPTNWQYSYLASLGILNRGKSKHRPRNDQTLFGGKYPFIQTAEVKAQNLIINFSQSYNEMGLSQSKLWPKGTLCITIAANIAETGILGIEACFPDSIVGFTPYKAIGSTTYIEYFIKATKEKINKWAPATAQKNINLATLENLVIPFCSLPEQNAIVEAIESRFSACDKLAETIDESLKKAKNLRQSILKQAFEGRLLSEDERAACRKEADWEPAEALLQRIKAEKTKKPVAKKRRAKRGAAIT